jgi:hypothetical protein
MKLLLVLFLVSTVYVAVGGDSPLLFQDDFEAGSTESPPKG